MSQGVRQQAPERVGLEFGPRSEKEVRASLEKEVEAECWTSLDPSLRDIADESVGFLDLRPGAGSEDPELRRVLIGRGRGHSESQLSLTLETHAPLRNGRVRPGADIRWRERGCRLPHMTVLPPKQADLDSQLG
jgi:hypothetical protein